MARPREIVAATKFADSLSHIDFDARLFASALIGQSKAIQLRIMGLLLHYVEIVAMQYDEGMWEGTPEELDVAFQAKRIHDAMKPFR